MNREEALKELKAFSTEIVQKGTELVIRMSEDDVGPKDLPGGIASQFQKIFHEAGQMSALLCVELNDMEAFTDLNRYLQSAINMTIEQKKEDRE